MKKILNTTILVLTLFSTFGCAATYIGTPVRVEQHTHKNHTSSNMLTAHYKTVKMCMGVSVQVPMPKVKIVEGNRVNCGGRNALGCYEGSRFSLGTVTIPEQTGSKVIKHEFIHHVLLYTQGQIDSGHTTAWFDRCS